MKIALALLIFFAIRFFAFSQTQEPPRLVAGFPVNYDEDAIPPYSLPDLFTLENGRKIKDSVAWMKDRRPELLKSIAELQYGKTPPAPKSIAFEVFDKESDAFNGKAIRRQVRIYLTENSKAHPMDLLIYLPKNSPKKTPVFFTISFTANSQTVDDKGVRVGEIWNREGKKVTADQASVFRTTNVEQFIDAGYGFATVYYGDIDPDFKKGFEHGIRKEFLKPGETTPKENEWGTISAWSWGLSRAMDYFEKDDQIDANRIALMGVSRLGKTVLWTGIRDTRFKMIIASCSGEGGAAIARRDFGENIKHMSDTSRYYYQFAPNYHEYSTHVDDFPFDAHTLVAMIAPRPLLLQTGNTDYWSDPKGEFIAAQEATKVYELFGENGPQDDEMPAAGDTSLLENKLGYYMHDGGHGTIPSDYAVFIQFMKTFL
ncbi:acetylxylan esterase [Algoriphagus sp. C2-6-M1]|uniref:glucuronyl esterase domain-containing protein n=1 Tax=Algoriphagus persicinus TaxID=3108754 RepID=UPI002B3A20F6|nr:acetylxylan esterase [Algoriphagus sp. C2-6-M1]MEB2781129.1 acetylxylan esterase [Algoriphagus sp. C2-6-M1]